MTALFDGLIAEVTSVSASRLALYALGINLLTFAVYAHDKAAARAGRWRVPESTLHLLMLVGGTIGALAGQRLLRHKTRKAAFQAVFWLLVLLQLALVAYAL